MRQIHWIRGTRGWMVAGLLFAAGMFLTACQASTPAPTSPPRQTEPAPTATPIPASPTAAPSPSPTPTATPAVDATAVRGQKITFWHPWQGELEQRTRDAVYRFNRDNPWGIIVEVRPFYSTGAFEDALASALSGGEESLPVAAAATSAELAALDEAEAVVDLSVFLEDPIHGFTEGEAAAYQPVFWTQDAAGERRLGIPLLRTGQVLFYNQSWAKELGFNTAPKTPEDLKKQSCAAAVKNNASRYLELFGTGGWKVDTSPLTGLSWLGAFGAQVFDPLAEQPYRFAGDESLEAVRFLSDLQSSGCAWIGREPSHYEDFAERKALFISGTLQDIPLQKAVMELYGNEDDWTVLGYPGQDGDPVVYAEGFSLALLTSPSAGNAAQQQAGWLFLRWMSQPAEQARLAEAWFSFPVSQAVMAQFSDYRANFPWDMINPLLEDVRPAPADADWFLASRVLQDATWSIFHLSPDQREKIFIQADETLRELRERP